MKDATKSTLAVSAMVCLTAAAVAVVLALVGRDLIRKVAADSAALAPTVSNVRPVAPAAPTVIPMPGGRSAIISPGHAAQVAVTGDGRTDGGTMTNEASGSAQGAGVTQTGTKEQGKLTSAAPVVNLAAMMGSGGETQMEWKAFLASGVGILALLGAALVALGILLRVWKGWPLGTALAIAGLGVIGVSALVANLDVVLWVAVGLIVILVGWLVYHYWAGQRAAKAATLAADGIRSGLTLGPADIRLPAGIAMPLDSYPLVQAVIDATVQTVKDRIMAASEKSGGVMAGFLASLPVRL